ncbi:MAG TPA: SpoIID/LytB domain-containing protein [Blastocatellia bacterium]|nr:SpoIID/LytB domain-containing protein [Blastocatellia bacterium]
MFTALTELLFFPRAPRVPRGYLLLVFFAFAACTKPSSQQQTSEAIKPLAFDDAAIQRAAASALADREGTILVMNPRDGRIRAVVNPRLAFEQAFPPGSAIKPFTALVAMRSGIADNDTRIACGRTFKRDDYQVVCSHKRVNNSLRLHHALAYSCNYYFANVAERMNAAGFFSTLDSFGFGQRTGVNASEANGEIKQSDWRVSTAIGNDENVLVTPVQLLTAFTALVNGGHLLRPRIAEANNFAAQEMRTLNLNPQQRAVLIEGMHGCTNFGSASEAGLDKLPYDVIGKTGTSGSSNGFRTQGWFVSFLLHRKSAKTVAPEDLHVAVLVFLKRAHGSEAATIAATFYRRLLFGEETQSDKEAEDQNPKSQISKPKSFRVHLVRENQTVAVELEDYVRGVLAAESSVETELEALKAQAIVSRTFALKNLQRHKDDGYDFCSLTHCQRYVHQLAEHNKALILQASEQSSGQVLRDDRKQIADVYFHAACGGRTTNLEAVWGAPSPSYLRSVNDDYCTTMSHKSWSQMIPSKELLRALQSNERSNIGSQIENVIITKRDASGRAEFITLEGARRKQVRGWEFALIVNRVLGWNMLKSARFDVQRAGNGFVFRGSGFGHGIGLCQEGAHVMARRGMSAQQILAQYLPGAKVMGTEVAALEVNPAARSFSIFHFPLFISHWLERFADTRFLLGQRMERSEWVMDTAQLRRAAMASEHFRLSYPATLEKREPEEVLRVLEAAHHDLAKRLNAASISLTQSQLLQVTLHDTTTDFVAVTGQPAWVAGTTRGDTIHLQPLVVLRKRGIVASTLRHELAHAALERLRHKHAPRWLLEGLAIHFAGEGRLYSSIKNKIEKDELEKKLSGPKTPAEMRVLYAAAYREVQGLIRTLGEPKVWLKAIKP